MALTMNVDLTTDVAGFSFTVNRVSCAGEQITPFSSIFTRELNAMTLGAVVVAGTSAHMFADAFVVLDAGCYDVLSRPTKDDGTNSADCSVGMANNVVVNDGVTTEVELISQCGGDVKKGSIDALVLLNHPPELLDLTFGPDKFICYNDLQTLCATFADPDHDPVDVIWTQVFGPPLQSGPTNLSSTKNADGSTTECVMIKHAGPGKVEMKATAYDLFKNPNGPGLITSESYFQSKGLLVTSHDDLQFPSYGLSNTTTCLCVPHPEIIDGVDNDCDGLIDEGNEICGNGVDDDGDGQIDEGSAEVCDGIDNDCNGVVDDGSATSVEVCDGKDNDCDGQIDEGLQQINEICDGIDNNCNGLVDEGGVCSPMGGCPGTCFESNASGNYQASGPYDACKITTADGGFDYYLCNNALGCSDYPGGCSLGGHQGPPCQPTGAVEVCGDAKDNDCNGAVDEGCCVPGAVQGQMCSGYDLVQVVYTSVNCATATQLVQACTAQCGAPPAGQQLSAAFCSGVNLYASFANGSCGASDQLVLANAPQCAPPPSGCPGTCFESNASGNYQASGPYDACKITTADGGFDYYLCNNALGCSDYPGGCSLGGHQGPPSTCTNTCFESDASGNYQPSGPYDGYKVCSPGGGFDYYLCNPALGCNDYPGGCFLGGHHP